MIKFQRNKSIYECHKKGISQIEIGKMFNLSQSSISEIVIAVKNGATLTKKDARGANSKLDTAQKIELSNFLTDPPQTYGYYSWDKWSVQTLIKDKFNVSYHENYIYNLMKRINFSSQKPKKKTTAKNQKK